MKLAFALTVSTFIALICSENSTRDQVTITKPDRDLVWGDINVIHTTDTHGWLGGHKPTSEPYYSADFGDFASFVTHMKTIADGKPGADLLVVDSGDIHDGTGLTDGNPSGGIYGHDASQIFKLLPYDVLTIGNHELDNPTYAPDVYNDFAPFWKKRYLTSNAYILVEGKEQPIGSQHVKFKTKNNRKIAAFGVLFNFIPPHNNPSVKVHTVETMVEEAWFNEAIKDDQDAFLLVGHMPVVHTDKDYKWNLVVDKIKELHPTTPILIFGGHSHIRNCNQLNPYTMALQSGKYLETIGWMSVNLKKNNQEVTFTRRYLDANLVTYQYHTKGAWQHNFNDNATAEYPMSGLNEAFNTPLGDSIKKNIKDLKEKFNLNFNFGNAPQDYTLGRLPFKCDQSLLSFYVNKAAPMVLAMDNSRSNTVKSILIVNSGLLRYDVFTGPFTKDDQMSVAEYRDEFHYIKDVPWSVAKTILGKLNINAKDTCKDKDPYYKAVPSLQVSDDLGMSYFGPQEDMPLHTDDECTLATKCTDPLLTPGYVTRDSCSSTDTGDDTKHCLLQEKCVNHYLSSPKPQGITEKTEVDVIFLDYLQKSVLPIVNAELKLQNIKRTYTLEKDVRSYSPILTNAVLGEYAWNHWLGGDH